MSNIYTTTQQKYKHVGDKKTIREKTLQSSYLYSRIHDLHNNLSGDFLDVGSGMGIWAKYVSDKTGATPYGIDLSEASIKIAQGNGVHAIKADIESKWEFEDERFDFVSAVQVIEHLLNPDIFLKEAHRVMKPGGHLIITTPNLASWFNRVIFMFGYQPFATEVSTEDKTLGLKFTRRFTLVRKPMGHIRVYTQRALVDSLEFHGFEIRNKIGGKVNYLPRFMRIFDTFFANFSSLASDLIIIATKK